MVVVVIDTNVLARYTHLLRKKGGPDLVQLLRATNGRHLIPEIVRRESLEQMVEMVNARRREADTAISALNSLLGVRLENPIPENEAIASSAVARFRALEPITIHDPLTQELYVAAGIRSTEGSL